MHRIRTPPVHMLADTINSSRFPLHADVGALLLRMHHSSLKMHEVQYVNLYLK